MHIEGSRLQPGDHDVEAVPFESLRGRHLVVEEKVDGSNSAIRFDASGRLLLQSRGHYLLGGRRERHFDLFKTWAYAHATTLYMVIGSRHIVYGEWVYAKHTIFYDRLPHYFLEFDVFDTAACEFLSTPKRRELLAGLPIASVPVLAENSVERIEDLTRLIGPSRLKSPSWRESLVEALSRAAHINVSRAQDQTDSSDDMEGLYVKVEEKGRVMARYKFVRPSFLTAVLDSENHWTGRPIVQNELAPGVDILAQSFPRHGDA